MEAKRCQQPVTFTYSGGRVTATNRYSFLTLEHLEFSWSLTADGTQVHGGALPVLKTAAGASDFLDVPLPPKPWGGAAPGAGCEYHLLVSARYREGAGTAMVPAGHEEAWDQWLIPSGGSGGLPRFAPPPRDAPAPEVTEDDDAVTVAAGPVVARIGRASGLLESLAYGGEELFAAPLAPNFWRPTTDNDYGANLQKECAQWRQAGRVARPFGDLTVSGEGPAAVVASVLQVGAEGTAARLATRYKVSAEGVRVDAQWLPEGQVAQTGGKLYALCGGVAYLRNVSVDRHLDVQGSLVRAQYKDLGDHQKITIIAEGRAAGEPLQHGDVVALQATTGKTEAELLVHELVPSSIPTLRGFSKVEANGKAGGRPVWTLKRAAGAGPVANDDEVTLEKDGQQLIVIDGAAALMGGAGAAAAFVLQVKEPPPPPRVGFRGKLAGGFETVEWFGRGPHESYVDRWVSSRVGLFSGPIAEQSFMYVRPQENGNKLETRWMALRRTPTPVAEAVEPAESEEPEQPSCGGLLIAVMTPENWSGLKQHTLGMQCHRYSLDDFDGPEVKESQAIRHAGELEVQAETDICVDAAQMGVGGIDSWGSKPLKQHLLSSKEPLAWSFQLRPLSTEDRRRHHNQPFGTSMESNRCVSSLSFRW